MSDPKTRRLKRLPIPGTLDHAFLQVGGRETAIAMTRLASHKDAQLKEFIRLYDDLPASAREDAGILEQLAMASGASPADYFGKVCAVAYRYNFDVASLAAAVASPMVIAKSAEYAMEKEGFRDRELILKSSKILEQTPLVSVQQNQSVTNIAASLPQISGRVSEIIRGELPIVDGELVEPDQLNPMPDAILGEMEAGPDVPS